MRGGSEIRAAKLWLSCALAEHEKKLREDWELESISPHSPYDYYLHSRQALFVFVLISSPFYGYHKKMSVHYVFTHFS